LFIHALEICNMESVLYLLFDKESTKHENNDYTLSYKMFHPEWHVFSKPPTMWSFNFQSNGIYQLIQQQVIQNHLSLAVSVLPSPIIFLLHIPFPQHSL
jgi:hypothetical protein